MSELECLIENSDDMIQCVNRHYLSSMITHSDCTMEHPAPEFHLFIVL
jgi:hypothetical protein